MDPFEPYNKDIRLSKFKINVSEMLEPKVIYGNDRQKCPTLSRTECPIKNFHNKMTDIIVEFI